MVEVADEPLPTHCFDQLIELGADEPVVVVGCLKGMIIDHYGDEYEGVPITYANQREQNGLGHALLTVEEHIDDDFMLVLSDTSSTQTSRAWCGASAMTEPTRRPSSRRCRGTRRRGTWCTIRISTARLQMWSRSPPSNLVMTGFYTSSPAIFHACHLGQPSGRGECEISDAIDLLMQSGRTIDGISLDGWRVDVGYPEDREEAEAGLEGEFEDGVVEATDVD